MPCPPTMPARGSRSNTAAATGRIQPGTETVKRTIAASISDPTAGPRLARKIQPRGSRRQPGDQPAMANRVRPLSPFMLGHTYRFQLTFFMSVLHPITGVALALGGTALVGWLMSIALR